MSTFLQVAPPELQQSLAKAYVVAKNAGQGDRIADVIFDYLHNQRASFSNEQDIRNLLVVNDIPAMLFDSGMVSQAVNDEVAAMKRVRITILKPKCSEVYLLYW